MRIKPEVKCFLGLLLLSSSAQATVLINQPGPYVQHLMGDGAQCLQDFAGDSTTAASVSVSAAAGQGFRVLNTSDPNTLLWVDLSSNANFAIGANQNAAISITPTGATVPVQLTGAGTLGNGAPVNSDAPPTCNTGVGYITCQTASVNGLTVNNAYANYSPGSILRVSFTLGAFCQATGASGNLCSTSNYLHFTNDYLTQPYTVNFYVINATTPYATQVSTPDTGSCTLGITSVPPLLTCPTGPVQDSYFPGDSQIYIDTGNYLTSANTSTSGAGTPVTNFVVLARTGTTAPTTVSNGTPSGIIADYLGNAGRQGAGGFVNATAANDVAHSYSANLYAMNDAGIFSNDVCPLPYPVQAQPVSGLLTESKCFIATAAFHDGRAAPVMMLRRFRDHVLSKSDLGQQFIETYYTYSPALAEWAWDKPVIRSFALRLLAPVELMAWAILKITHAEENSPQPYIDRVKKELAEQDAKKGVTPPSSDSYIEKIKKKIGPGEAPAQGYSENIKKDLPPEESSQGYAEKEKAKLPPEDVKESPIKMVKEKRDRYPVPERPPITAAFGFKLGVSPGLNVNNTKNPSAGATFDNIYGSGWQPDLILHGEKQFIHSENFGSLAIGGDVGVSYAEGFGQLSFPFGDPATTKAQTKFSFLQVPVMVDAYYRFNLLRALRPYVGVGVGGMFYDEIRNDGNRDKYGVSAIYDINVGAALLLDFLDPTTTGESFLSAGVQHSYLIVEYNFLDSFVQTGVTFTRDGIYAGFLFEY